MNEKLQYVELTPMMRYFIYSIFVTLIDTVIVWSLYRVLAVNLVIANSTGVVSGFIIHYLLSSKAVFRMEFGIPGFVIYLGTFFMGLLSADALIYVGERFLFIALRENLSFLFSKGISIVIPFFFLYFMRKSLFGLLKKNQKYV